LMMTMEPGDTGADRRPIGNYFIGQSASGGGIRSEPYQGPEGGPYSTDFAVNPVTYGATNSSGLSNPHGVGYVWAQILWEMTWELIDAFGWDPDLYNADGMAGNQIAMNLVMTGLKLQPCGPGFVDGRDAILAADQALYGGVHTDLLWEAFARRGLGALADQGTSLSRTDQVESFVVPEAIPPAAITDLAAVPDGDFVTLTFTATGDDGTVGTATEYVVRTSDTPILTEDDWETATPAEAAGTPEPSGSPQEVTVTSLAFDTEYHIAVKALDDNLNPSGVSNSAVATTLGPPSVDVATDPIVFELLTGESGSTPLQIGNMGESELRFSLAFSDAASGRPARARHSAPAPQVAEAPAPREPKGAPEASGGARLAADAGGPDAFGYRWIDSNEPGGIAYEWVDISATGTDLTLGDDDSEEVTLPFVFPYYGGNRTSVRISSNGYLAFGGGSGIARNTTIPGSNVPNDAIYPYWDDLDPGNAGTTARIVYQDMGDGRFVVSWLDVPHYAPIAQGGEDGSFTFQVILEADGAILFQYQTLDFGNSSEDSATIGIEAPGGDDGLQVAFNQPYAEEELAIRFLAFWGDALALSGTVPAGGMETVTLTADAAGIEAGTYDGVLTVRTNDPAKPSTVVPLQLIVNDPNAPLVGVDRPTIEADVPRGETVEETFTLSNMGGSDLNWILREENEMLPDWLSVSERNGTLASGASTQITLTYDPGVAYAPATSETATLEIRSNDPRGVITMEVTMNVLPGVSTDGELDFDGPYALGEVAPNPVGRSATVPFAVREAQTVTAEVLDLLGRRVALLHDGPVSAMTRQALTLDAAPLASGAYVLVVRGETFTASRRLTIAR
ncbi:MAG: M36 family metallopeptidase, partial [Bacteroidota bacterium]